MNDISFKMWFLKAIVIKKKDQESEMIQNTASGRVNIAWGSLILLKMTGQ